MSNTPQVPDGFMDIEFTIDEFNGTCKSTIIRGGKSKASSEECTRQLDDICNTPVDGYEGKFGEDDGDGFTEEHYEATRPKVPIRTKKQMQQQKKRTIIEEPEREKMGLGYGNE